MTAAGRIFYFQHIPKTAGTSIKVWLASHFGSSLCPLDIADHLVAVSRRDLDQYHAFAGHFHCYLAPYLERDLVTVTVLRDPLSRTRSHWHQVRRHEQHPHHERVSRQTFTEFVEDDSNRVMIEDYQARYLVRMPVGLQAMAELFSQEERSRYALAEGLEQASLIVGKSVLAAAASVTLRSMAAVGSCDMLGDFFVKVAEILGLAPPTAIPRENATEDDVANILSASALAKLRVMTQIDQHLYDTVGC
ncbi:hypothetical protein [Lichenicoccus sp.]|uniref:hypothetical protein n=1 Tax=Lichenicoccus sp. TaxID=2781899 RepID=UPI003D0E8D90